MEINADRLLEAFAGPAAEHIAAGQVRAVRHPLGFVCLPLWRLTDLGFCIHIWTTLVEPARLATSPVHCHSWDLASLVLYGTIRNEEINVFDTTDPTHRVFEVEQHGDVDEIRATARLVRYSVSAGQMIMPGEVYQLPAGTFHNTIVPTREAATLVVAWTRPGGMDRSVGPLDVPTHHQPRRYCDADESALAVRTVAEHLAEAGVKRLAGRPDGMRRSISPQRLA